MLSVEQCRKILGRKCLLSDKELELLRDQMYGLADVIVDCFASRSTEVTAGNFHRALELVPADLHSQLEERAAIVQFDGKLPRDTAERFAISRHLEEQAGKNAGPRHG